MLSKFRSSVNNIFVKILFSLIGLSFLTIGTSSFFSNDNGNKNIVVFKYAEPISLRTFFAHREKEIEFIQQKNNVRLTKEDIKLLELDKKILQKLINESMLSYLAKIYNIDISDETVIKFVKKEPYFKNKNGNFDINIFKSTFYNSRKLQDQYLKTLKTDIVKSFLLDIFMESFEPSKIMISTLANYMAETKCFDLISINLDNKRNIAFFTKPNNNEVSIFYKKNQENFSLPELRSFKYIIFSKDFLSKRFNLAEKEIQDYYKWEKENLDKKPYSLIKNDIQTQLDTPQVGDIIAQFLKILKKDVETGLNLEDIALKYNIQISSVRDISEQDLSNSSHFNALGIDNFVFKMLEAQVSYPKFSNQDEIILLQLTEIKHSRKKTFEEVKNEIFSTLLVEKIANENIKILEQVQKNYHKSNINFALLQNKGIEIKTNKSISRVDATIKEKITSELIHLIFKTKKGQSTGLVRDGNKAYFAFIKDNKINFAKANQILESFLLEIKRALKEEIFNELISYLVKKNDIKRNY